MGFANSKEAEAEPAAVEATAILQPPSAPKKRVRIIDGEKEEEQQQPQSLEPIGKAPFIVVTQHTAPSERTRVVKRRMASVSATASVAPASSRMETSLVVPFTLLETGLFTFKPEQRLESALNFLDDFNRHVAERYAAPEEEEEEEAPRRTKKRQRRTEKEKN